MSKKVILILLTVLLLSSCKSGSIDINRNLPSVELIQLNASEYLDLAWIDTQTVIIFDDDTYPKIWVFDVNSRSMAPVQIETTCKRPYLRGLQVLPNHHGGYILVCSKSYTQTIQEIDPIINKSGDIYTESSIRWLGRFTYSPDMKELILVDVNGLYLESSLYYLDTNGERINITPEFQRADFPAWSPTDDLVAFLGTKPYVGSDDPKSWDQIEGLFDYPWRLYMYHPRSGEIEELSIEIVHPGRFKWSPNGRLLAFTGRYKGVPGVWIIDMQNNLSVTRVVSEIASFDFSPNSKSLAYVGQTSVETKNAIYIVDLSGLIDDH